jgi:Outer membrane protein beta-barrel domain
MTSLSINLSNMVKIVFAVILMLLSWSTYAQLNWGLKAGLNVSNIHAADLPTYFDAFKPSVGFHIGLFGGIKMTDKISVSPELLFTTRGVRSENSRVTLSYVEMPLALIYSPLRVISVEVGPSVSFKVAARAKEGGTSIDISDEYTKNVDVGANLGVRGNLLETLSVYCRYYYGMSKVDETFFMTVNGDEFTTKEYNRSLQLGVMYRFPN